MTSDNIIIIIVISAKKFVIYHLYVDGLVSICLSTFMVQMKERSIQTLGYLPVGDGDFPHQKRLLQGLMDSVEVCNILAYYGISDCNAGVHKEYNKKLERTCNCLCLNVF